MTSGFENSRRVPLAPPHAYDATPDPWARPAALDARDLIAETLRRTIIVALGARTPTGCRRRLLALQWLLDPHRPTQRSLARQLGISDAAASKLITETRNQLFSTHQQPRTGANVKTVHL